MDVKELPDVALLHKALIYEPDTGRLVWRERSRDMCPSDAHQMTWNKRFAGKEAGCHSYKGVCFHFLGRLLKAHRVAWYLHYGVQPSGQIDHINGNPCDNRLINLRDVTRAENQRNMKRRSNNRSGSLGVSWDTRRKKWYASIRAEGKTKSLGRHDTLEAAINARKQADAIYGYHANHGRDAPG